MFKKRLVTLAIAIASCISLPAPAQSVNLTLVGAKPPTRALEGGSAEFLADTPDKVSCVVVRGQQTLMRISEPVFVMPETKLTWSWKKEKGKVCIIQLTLKNPQTNQMRYFGYGAGTWTEPPSGDPTVEIFVTDELPRKWTSVERNLYQDIQKVLGWESAQITEVYLSPWDGDEGYFADMTIKDAANADLQTVRKQQRLEKLSQAGSGHYDGPLPLPKYDDKREEVFETSFEECAPGRNSAANEWSAFGADTGYKDFNAMGRDMHVRYPAYDLVFRLYDGDKEIKPDSLDSFRLGLLGRYPAISGQWDYDKLHYNVTAMTVPDAENGAFDLYLLEIHNPLDHPIESKLVVGVEGPPDMRFEAESGPVFPKPGQGVVRGLGDAPFLIADPPARTQLLLHDFGLCDKRAKAYATGDGPGKTEPAIARYRLGLDGLPVVYRFKAEADKKYIVCLVSTPHIGGYYLENPKAPGDLIYEYNVEGCSPQTLDYVKYIEEKPRPLYACFDAAKDANRDGYIEVRSGVAANSKIRHTRLSAIYVFPEGTKIDNPESVYSGAMNDKCVWHIDVGATPEQGPQNQYYDKSDIGIARLDLVYLAPISPGTTQYWLKVPSIHRREPVSMGYIAHAFRAVLPGEAVPPFGPEKIAALEAVDPKQALKKMATYWDDFFAKAAQFDVPNKVLDDIYYSRLATRAIMDVKTGDGIYYNPCSPFFYFDHAYRDQAYVIYSLDMAGLHDRAARLLRVYCMDVDEVKKRAPNGGPISFDGKPLQLGMLENGLWNTRPGQYDTQGQNIWALVQHYKLSGDRAWLEDLAYPFIKRGATWIVNSRHKHMRDVGNPDDLRYGLIEPGGMEVMEVGKGMHMYYMNGFAILGLREAADAAQSLGKQDDAALFTNEAADLKSCLHKSFEKTFKRTGLYEGNLWFGVEPEGDGMYGFWAHNCLLWPCQCIDPQDPMWTATTRKLETMANAWGGGMHSEGKGGFWPYIGVDRAVSHILRSEPDKALDYFCAFTDTAGGTFSWGEGYGNVIAGGDQPHFWADAQWINLFRHLFAMEDGATLMITPAMFRRWTAGPKPVGVQGLPTHFGDLTLKITPEHEGKVTYSFTIKPKGDQDKRPLEKILLYPRIADGKAIKSVTCNGEPVSSFTNDVVILPKPARNEEIVVECEINSL